MPRGKAFGKAVRLALTAAVMLGAAVLPVRAQAILSIGFNSSTGSVQAVGTRVLHEEIDRRLPGRFLVDERGGPSVGSENQLVEAIRSGAFDIIVVTAPVVGAVVPELGVFDIPFLFRDRRHAETVVKGPIGRAIAGKFPAKGLVLLDIGEMGFRHLTNSKRPIRAPEDLAGLKIRVIPNEIHQMSFKALGAQPVPLQFFELYGALTDGRVDGQENPVEVLVLNKLFEVQKHLTLTGHFFTGIAFVANGETFDGLTENERTEILAAARVAADATRKLAMETERSNLENLKKTGIQIVETIDRGTFEKAVASLEPEFKNRFGAELLKQIRDAR